MFTSSIIMFISWPVIIVLAYYAVRFALHLYEKKQTGQVQEADQKVAVK